MTVKDFQPVADFTRSVLACADPPPAPAFVRALWRHFPVQTREVSRVLAVVSAAAAERLLAAVLGVPSTRTLWLAEVIRLLAAGPLAMPAAHETPAVGDGKDE